MYLIVNGKGYSIKDDKAYKVTFGTEGKMKVDENDFIEVENQPKYTYDELIRKLNVAYMLEQAKLKANKSQNESEELKALREENEGLNLKIEELKNKIAELELENEELKKVPEKEETQPLEEEKTIDEEPKENEVPETDEAKPIKKK
jgi:hypothetical protein